MKAGYNEFKESIKLVRAIHLYGALCYYVFGVLYFYLLDSSYLFISNVIAGSLCFCNLVIYEKFEKHLLIHSFLTIVYIGLVNVAIHVGVNHVPLIFWGMSVPIAAAFICGFSGVFAWGLLGLFYFPLVIYLRKNGFYLEMISLSDYKNLFFLSATYIGLLVFFLYSILLHKLKLKEVVMLLGEFQDELIDSNRRFQSLSDASFEGVIVSDKGTIIDVNNATCTMFGYSSQELIGRKAIDLVSLEFKDIVQGKILSEYEFSYESNGLRKDGSGFPIEVRGKMFFYREKKVRVTTIRDLTVKKAAEDEVRILKGLIPICSSCKKIRDDKGIWNRMEKYISEHSEAEFSHSCCNDCIRKLYPDVADEIIAKYQEGKSDLRLTQNQA